MKPLVAVLLALATIPALAQPGQGRGQGMRQMRPPERRMGWEERQRLREEVRSGQMTRDEARQRWREEREQRGIPTRSPEERQKMRRDVQDANRDMQRR